MAFAGAVLSWVAFVVPATLLLLIGYALSHWNGFRSNREESPHTRAVVLGMLREEELREG